MGDRRCRRRGVARRLPRPLRLQGRQRQRYKQQRPGQPEHVHYLRAALRRRGHRHPGPLVRVRHADHQPDRRRHGLGQHAQRGVHGRSHRAVRPDERRRDLRGGRHGRVRRLRRPCHLQRLRDGRVEREHAGGPPRPLRGGPSAGAAAAAGDRGRLGPPGAAGHQRPAGARDGPHHPAARQLGAHQQQEPDRRGEPDEERLRAGAGGLRPRAARLVPGRRRGRDDRGPGFRHGRQRSQHSHGRRGKPPGRGHPERPDRGIQREFRSEQPAGLHARPR